MGEVKKLPVIREDLYQFHFVSDVSLSPDGGLAAYVVTQADKEENGYKSSLWVVDLSTGRNRKLAERGGAKSPVWLDSGRILFVSGRDKMEHEDKPCTRYYEISVNGGEASLYLTVPVKADKIRPIGDKLWLLSAVADENESKTREINQHARTWDEVAVRGKDYDIYEELPFRFNGKGVINRKRPVLYLFLRQILL